MKSCDKIFPSMKTLTQFLPKLSKQEGLPKLLILFKKRQQKQHFRKRFLVFLSLSDLLHSLLQNLKPQENFKVFYNNVQ